MSKSGELKNTRTINARVLKGFRDYLPEDAVLREEVINRIRTVFKLFGFVPLETTSLEYEDILSGKYGEEGNKLMYRFLDNGRRRVALRYDLTVPLSRVVNQYQDKIPLPFKRYQIAQVWRAENPQRGRFREFTQCDIDIVGTNSLLAEAELIALINVTLINLGVQNFIILLNNRKLLDGILEHFGVQNQIRLKVLSYIDKLEKLGTVKVKKALLELIGRKRIVAFLDTINFQGSVEKLKKNLKSNFYNELVREGLQELTEVQKLLRQFEVDSKRYKIDLSIVRGLDYYTSMVIETKLVDYPSLGSIFSGGRYDKLIGLFTGNEVPAVGVSLGLDRLLSAKKGLGIDKLFDGFSKNILVANFKDTQKESLLLVNKLRRSGIDCEFYYEPEKLEKQLKYAIKKGTKFILFLGPKEVKEGLVRVRDLDSGEEKLVEQGEIERFIRQLTKN